MTPEEHLRRMRDDEVWNLAAPPRTASRRAGAIGGAPSRRTQIWTTAVVAAAVVAVAGVAIAVAPAQGGLPAGPGGPAAVSTPEPSSSLSPAEQPSPIPSVATPAPSPEAQTSKAGSVEAVPSAAPVAAEPSAAPQRATTHGGRPALEFVAADPADVARGKRAVTCLQDKGVRYVDLAAPDEEGIRYLEFGGAGNDQRSISLGLQYSDACIAAAGR